MNWQDWLVWFVFVTSLVYLLTESAVGAVWRLVLAPRHPMLAVLVYCRACTGFWVGVVTASLFPIALTPMWWRRAIAGGAVMMIGYVWNAMAGNYAYETELGKGTQEEG